MHTGEFSYRPGTNESESKHQPETETAELLLIPSETLAHMPNYVKTNSPLQTIYSHGDLSEVCSPLNNSSVDGPPRARKKRSENVIFSTAFADKLDKLSKERREKKDSLEDLSFGFDQGTFRDPKKQEKKPKTSTYEKRYERLHKSEQDLYTLRSFRNETSLKQEEDRALSIEENDKVTDNVVRRNPKIAFTEEKSLSKKHLDGGSSQGQGGSGNNRRFN